MSERGLWRAARWQKSQHIKSNVFAEGEDMWNGGWRWGDGVQLGGLGDCHTLWNKIQAMMQMHTRKKSWLYKHTQTQNQYTVWYQLAIIREKSPVTPLCKQLFMIFSYILKISTINSCYLICKDQLNTASYVCTSDNFKWRQVRAGKPGGRSSQNVVRCLCWHWQCDEVSISHWRLQWRVASDLCLTFVCTKCLRRPVAC